MQGELTRDHSELFGSHLGLLGLVRPSVPRLFWVIGGVLQ